MIPKMIDKPTPAVVCPECTSDRTAMRTIPYVIDVRWGGKLYRVLVPELHIPVCEQCGAKVFTLAVDDQITAAVEQHRRQTSRG